MASIKRGAPVASTLMLIAVVISACNQPYSQQPAATATPITFQSPIAQTPGMDTVGGFGTATALALNGTPLPGLATQTPSTPIDATSQSLTQTVVASTPIVSTIPAFTSTATLAVGGTQPTAGAPTSSGPLPTSAPVGSRPATYTLRSGEFPYCIARRFDVDPDALLRLNGLASGTILYPNRTLQIPQSGSFPGTRALRNHPTTYAASSGQTVYSVACLFGDIDPAAIAQANNISVDATLTAGQQLSIP
jgi:LysM repeat protein